MAARFWKSQPVSGAIVSVASPPQVRLTVASTTGMTTGDVRTVFGVVGTTEANGTWTITVIDATHIDLQGTTFANLYTSGGKIDGKWDTTNTNNWVSTSNGTDYGQTVPSSADTVTLDGSSGGGTVTPNFGGTITIISLTLGAFTGTFDNSVNNNNMTFTLSGTALSLTGTGTRTVKLGSATYTISGSNGSLNAVTTTNMTFNAGTSDIRFTGNNLKSMTSFGINYATITLPGPGGSFSINSTATITNWNVTGPIFIQRNVSNSPTVTNPIAWVGTPSAPIGIATDTLNVGSTINLAAGSTMTWASLRDFINLTNGNVVANNSLDVGGNSNVTINPPSGGGGFSSYIT